MKEQVILFGESDSLIGVMTYPEESGLRLPSVILLGAGLSHHVGPNRLNVKIARKIACFGFPVLRFDFSGVGDSPATIGAFLFDKRAVSETKTAMNFLEHRIQQNKFILMGICSGAEISYKTARCDDRVDSIVMINPIWHMEGLDSAKNRRIRKRTRIRNLIRNLPVVLTSITYWKKVLTLDADFWGLLANEIRFIIDRIPANERKPQSMKKTMKLGHPLKRSALNHHLLYIYSERDIGLDYLKSRLKNEFKEIECKGKVKIIKGANHIFTPLWSQEALLNHIIDFLSAVYKIRPTGPSLTDTSA